MGDDSFLLKTSSRHPAKGFEWPYAPRGMKVDTRPCVWTCSGKLPDEFNDGRGVGGIEDFEGKASWFFPYLAKSNARSRSDVPLIVTSFFRPEGLDPRPESFPTFLSVRSVKWRKIRSQPTERYDYTTVTVDAKTFCFYGYIDDEPGKNNDKRFGTMTKKKKVKKKTNTG